MNRHRRPRCAARLDRVYSGSSATLRRVRYDVTTWLDENGIEPELQGRAALVLSELATNALQASPGSEYNVHGSLSSDGEVVLSVVSRTRYERPPPREHWGPPSLMSEGGRGLMIVDDLSTDVEVELPSTGMVVVTATLHGESPA
ncbi:MAG TPA: ATP-binding protein [Ilumatobacteraceae bacterium]|jgi:anti-sigma regulatory factor (Ser/Thr protein kinase)